MADFDTSPESNNRTSPNTEAAQTMPPVAEDPTAISSDMSFGSRARSLFKEAGNLTKDAGRYVATATSTAASTAAKNVKEEFVKAGQEVKSGMNYIAALGLETLAGSKEKGQSFASDLKKATPIIGATAKYAEAWREYHEGKNEGNEDKIRDSKIKVVLAFADAGLDLSLFGVARVAKSAKLLGRGLTLLTTLRATQSPPVEAVRSGVLSHGANHLLKSESVQKIVTGFLNSVTPRNTAKPSAEQ